MAEQGGTNSGTKQGVRGCGEPPFRGAPTHTSGTADAIEQVWFVVWTNPQCDERAQRAIERAGFEARQLFWRTETIHNRTKQPIVRVRRLLARCLFVRLPVRRTRRGIEAPFGVVRGCNGVERFLGAEERMPSAVSSDELGEMLAIEARFEFLDADGVEARRPFMVGDMAVVCGTPLDGRLVEIRKLLGGREAVVGSSEIRDVRIAIDRLSPSG